MASVLGLAEKCESEGVTIYSGVEVREFEFASDDSVKTVVTDEGSIEVGEQLVLARARGRNSFGTCSASLR